MRRLVHHQQVAVFKDYIQGQASGARWLGGAEHPHHHGIALPHPVGSRPHLAVDRTSRISPAFAAGPGTTQGLGQTLIQAGAGIRRRHSQGQGFRGFH